MSSSHPARWIAFFLCGALSVLGCVGSTDAPQGETGSLSLDLVIGDGIVINEVVWRITGNDMDMSGVIDVRAPRSTASVEVFGLPPGEEDYTVTLTALSEDEEVSCEGSADFNVVVGVSTPVMVMLNCKLPERLGGVRVNGKFNICAELTKATAAPLETSVSNDIDLTSQAEDADEDDIHYRWTATGGSIDDQDAPSTTYTCLEAGDHKITIQVTDNDEYCDMATWTFDVTCVLGEAECQGDPDCEDGEVCVAGRCVLDVECITPDDCDDDNDCTADICADGVCSNPNQEPDESCNQGGGSFCDGDGNCVDCNVDLQCDVGEMCTENACVPEVECITPDDCDDENDCTADICADGECSNPNQEPDATCDQGGGSVCDGEGTCVECNDDAQCGDEICVVNTCVGDPDLFCNEGLCLTNETARDNCRDAFLLCVALEPANEEECLLAGLAECNVDCLVDGDCDAGEVCNENNLCVPAPDCISPGDCIDGNPCTIGVCTDGTCSFDPLVDSSCDSGTGSGDGTCDNTGSCVSNDDCTENADCPDDDGNECTVPVCIQTGAPYVCDEDSAPADGNECDGGAGTCDGGECMVEEPLSTCDPTGQGNVVACQSPELLALDCFLLGSGAPLVLDPVITPTAPAFAGVPLTVEPVQTLNLPASLVCGFASVLTTATVYNSEANLDIAGAAETGYALDSWLDPADPFGGANRSSPHGPTTFDFIVGCGNQFGACAGGVCNGGITACTDDADCAGTGPGVVVPFIAGSPTMTPGTETLTPSAPGAVVFSYGYDDLKAYVATSIGTLCLGAPAVEAGPPPAIGGTCGFICVAGDRNGDSVPTLGRGAPVGTGNGNPNPTVDPLDSPRVMYDTQCDKLGVGACGGTACASTPDCPLAPFGQTCNTTAGVCNPAPVGPGIPVCCTDIPGGEAFFDFSGASNVCATGQPGSDLAATEAPCNGETGTSTGGLRCEGAVTCGNCQQVTGDAPGGVFTPGVDCPESTPGCAGPPNTCDLCPWPTVEFCSSSPLSGALGTCDSDENKKCPNGDSDCTGSASVPADEDFCVVPCAVNVCATGDRIGDTCLRDIDCQRCTGGANDNGNCTGAADCPAACVGGFNNGLSCLANADCPGICAGVAFPCANDAACGPFGPCGDIGACGTPGVCDANTGTCPIIGCDSDSCCEYMQARFPNATQAEFPELPVNPAP